MDPPVEDALGRKTRTEGQRLQHLQCQKRQADRGPESGGHLANRSSIHEVCPAVPNAPSQEPQQQQTEGQTPRRTSPQKSYRPEGDGTLDPEARRLLASWGDLENVQREVYAKVSSRAAR